MSIPKTAHTQIKETLRDNNTLSEENLNTVLTSLENNTPVNWNLILNTELEKGEDNEVNP